MREKAGESLFTLHNCVIQSESWRSERNEHSGHQLLRKNNSCYQMSGRKNLGIMNINMLIL